MIYFTFKFLILRLQNNSLITKPRLSAPFLKVATSAYLRVSSKCRLSAEMTGGKRQHLPTTPRLPDMESWRFYKRSIIKFHSSAGPHLSKPAVSLLQYKVTFKESLVNSDVNQKHIQYPFSNNPFQIYHL